jgi:general secretion pathway protein D
MKPRSQITAMRRAPGAVRPAKTPYAKDSFAIRCLVAWFFITNGPALDGQLGQAATRAQTPVAPPSASAFAPAATPRDERVGPIKLHDVGIDQILELLERWSDKALLRPQQLPAATLSLTLKDEVTKAQGLRAIETLLNLNGIAVTPLDENFLKITPANTAKSEAPELITGSTLALPPSGRIASKLFKLKFLRVTEFMPQVGALLNSAFGAPAVFEKANAALITDSLTNLQRVETLMLQLDHADSSGLEPRFYTLRYAKANDVVNKMKAMLTGVPQSQLGTATNYTADDRTNQIVLFCDPEQHPLFDKLIARLDIKSGQDTRNETISLKHAAAKDVATLLSQLVAGQNSAARGSGQEAARINVAANVAPAPNPTPSGAVPPTPVRVDARSLAFETVNQFSPLLTVLPEERSNSLVVAGTDDDLRLIRELVARIDVLLAQVRIEVVIAEVTLTDNSTTGISELGLKIEGDKLTGFSASLPGGSIKDGMVTRPDPAVGKAVPVTGPWDLAAMITIASTPRKNNTNILSVPNIITTHNREGRIFVGEERPMISSYLNDSLSTNTSTTGVGAGYRSTVTSKDIGISLTVKPLIGSDGTVQLDIKQEVNDVLGDITIDGNPQPRIGRRSTESFVSAKSGEIIVLGGLQRSTQSRSTSRLGPVPIVGDLLGARTREKTRTDLIFFLRPVVLTNTDKDNSAAYEQVEQLPKDPRKELKKLLPPKSGT